MAAGEITVGFTVNGQVGKATVGPFSGSYALTGQTGALGPQQVTVPAAAGVASVAAQLAALSTQRVLFMCSDQRVTYQLNSDGVNRTIEPGAPAIHPGDPVVTSLAFGGNGSTDATVTILQLGTAGTPSTVVGGSLFTQEVAPASNPGGTPAFTLNWEPPPAAPPLKPVRVLVYVDGVMAAFDDYTVVGTTLTWTGTTSGALAGSERLAFVA